MKTATRPGRTRRTALAAAAISLACVGATACQGDDQGAPAVKTSSAEQGSGKQTDAEPLAEVTGPDDLTLRIVSAQPSHGGKWLTVRATITNTGTGNFTRASNWRGDYTDLAKSHKSVGGATLVDETSMKRYYVLRDTTGLCLCTTNIVSIGPGESYPVTAQFPAPPAKTPELGFQLPTFPVATFTTGS